MKVICGNCQKKLNIPDEKIPAGGRITFKCPNCKEAVTVGEGDTGSGEPAGSLPALDGIPETTPGPVAFDETRDIAIPALPAQPAKEIDPFSAFDSIESEMDVLTEGSLRAMLADNEHSDKIYPVLVRLGCAVSKMETAKNALEKMRYNNYDILVINEKFDCDNIGSNILIQNIATMGMENRRKIFVAVVGDGFKSMDPMASFAVSADLVISPSDLGNCELIIKKGIKDKEFFYATLRSELVAQGLEME